VRLALSTNGSTTQAALFAPRPRKRMQRDWNANAKSPFFNLPKTDDDHPRRHFAQPAGSAEVSL
jgi:hypothetical protein